MTGEIDVGLVRWVFCVADRRQGDVIVGDGVALLCVWLMANSG